MTHFTLHPVFISLCMLIQRNKLQLHFTKNKFVDQKIGRKFIEGNQLRPNRPNGRIKIAAWSFLLVLGSFFSKS